MTGVKSHKPNGAMEWEEVYRYDVRNRNITTIRREWKSWWGYPDGPGKAQGWEYELDDEQTKHSVYDEAGLYSLLYELDGTHRVTSAAMHGAAVDMVLAEDRVDFSGSQPVHELNWLLGDHQGTPTVIADGDDSNVPQVKSSTIRSAFGKPISQAGAVDSAFGFQGQVENETTGEGVFRNRNYSSQQGRFTSQDPIRFASGQTNHYQFVGNHPHMGTDPSGLFEFNS